MGMNVKIWEPVRFDTRWNEVKTGKFDNLRPSWDKKRVELCGNQEQYEQFIDQLKRKQAVDTGILERMYDLKRGVTETFVKEGFVDSYLQHGDTSIDQQELMNYLKDNFDAINFIFNFIKDERTLSVGYIKELHSLITRHQDTVEAVDSLGNIGRTDLLKGEFKKMPNNPRRPDGVVCEYCPPLQVDSEMDNLIKIFNNEMEDSHILVKTAFLHHAFTRIHPFQDGNGRIARLLASFVLIKDNLFPLSIDRDEKIAYIGSLEDADSGSYQSLVDLIADNQVKSMELALNLETVEKNSYNGVLKALNAKIVSKNNAAIQRQKTIANNMDAAFAVIKEQTEYYKNDLTAALGHEVAVDAEYCPQTGEKNHYYTYQISRYAKMHKYYFNSSLPRSWTRLRIVFDVTRKYQLVLSLHHYGFDNSAFALGGFIEKEQQQNSELHQNNEILNPLGVPPLVFSSERDISALKESICGQIEAVITATLAYIAEELP
jgi:Fic family protein